MNLESRIAIVTGASRGAGAAFAAKLVEKGVKVYGLARSLDALNAIQDKLGNSFIPVRLDITNREKVESWVGSTFNEKHSPDILINNAGAGYFGKVDDLPLDEWDKMINSNLNAVFHLTSLIVPFMKQNKDHSHIINMGSILGKIGSPERSGYCASKFALQGFSEALFKELRYDKIKVTCLNPGSIETGFFKESGVEPHGYMLQPKDLADTIIHVLETPGNMLINEMTIRPLYPKKP